VSGRLSKLNAVNTRCDRRDVDARTVRRGDRTVYTLRAIDTDYSSWPNRAIELVYACDHLFLPTTAFELNDP